MVDSYKYIQINGLENEILDKILIETLSIEELRNEIVKKNTNCQILKFLRLKYKISQKSNIDDETLKKLALEYLNTDKKLKLYSLLNKKNTEKIINISKDKKIIKYFDNIKVFIDNIDEIVNNFSIPEVISFIRVNKDSSWSNVVIYILNQWISTSNYSKYKNIGLESIKQDRSMFSFKLNIDDTKDEIEEVKVEKKTKSINENSVSNCGEIDIIHKYLELIKKEANKIGKSYNSTKTKLKEIEESNCNIIQDQIDEIKKLKEEVIKLKEEIKNFDKECKEKDNFILMLEKENSRIIEENKNLNKDNLILKEKLDSLSNLEIVEVVNPEDINYIEEKDNFEDIFGSNWTNEPVYG